MLINANNKRNTILTKIADLNLVQICKLNGNKIVPKRAALNLENPRINSSLVFADIIVSRIMLPLALHQLKRAFEPAIM